MKKTILAIVVLLIIGGGYITYQSYENYENRIAPTIPKNEHTINLSNVTEEIICTADAKQCKDGTFVGRIGPKCEFAKCPGKPIKPNLKPTEFNQIELPDNIISEKDCSTQGGEVWNTLGKTDYEGELIGKIEGLKCPCACLVKPKPSDTIWVDVNGNLEEFKGDLDDIKTYDDCKKAGFSIKDEEPEICTIGKPYMTNGRYKTFTNNSIEAGKNCTDYTYSTCPGSCVAKCTSSSCSEPNENGEVACTSDCDGPSSCVEKNKNIGEECPPNFPDPIKLCGIGGEVIATKYNGDCIVEYGCK